MSYRRRLRRLRAGIIGIATVSLVAAQAAPAWAHRDAPGQELTTRVRAETVRLTENQNDGLDNDAELLLVIELEHEDHAFVVQAFENDEYNWNTRTYRPSYTSRNWILVRETAPDWHILSELWSHDECTPRNRIKATIHLTEVDVDGFTSFIGAFIGSLVGAAGGAAGGAIAGGIVAGPPGAAGGGAAGGTAGVKVGAAVGAAIGAALASTARELNSNDDLGKYVINIPENDAVTSPLRGSDGGADVVLSGKTDIRPTACTGSADVRTSLLSPAERSALIYDPLEQALASAGSISVEAGNPSGLTGTELQSIQATLQGITAGWAGIVAATALAEAEGLDGYEAAAGFMLEIPAIARSDPEAAVSLYRRVHEQALALLEEAGPSSLTPSAPLPPAVIPLTGVLSVRQGAELQIPVYAFGGEGPVRFSVAGTPPGAEAWLEPLGTDQRLQQLVLHLGAAAPGEYSLEIAAVAGDGGEQATAEVMLSVHPSPAVEPNRRPSIGTAPDALRLTTGSAAAEIVFADLFIDPDGDLLEISAELADDGVAELSAAGGRLLIRPLAPGRTRLTVTAADDAGAAAAVTIPVTVGAASGPETVTLSEENLRALLSAGGSAAVRSGSESIEVRITPEAVQTVRESETPLLIETALGGMRIPAEALDGAPSGSGIHLLLRAADAAESAAFKEALTAAAPEALMLHPGIVLEAELLPEADGSGSAASPSFRFGSPVEIWINTAGTPDPASTAAVQRVEDRLRSVPTRFDNGRILWRARSAGRFAVSTQEIRFTDTVNHWAAEDIQLLAAKWIVNGVGDGRFEPQRPVNRAEATAIVARGLGLNLESTGSFTDVPQGAWYNGEIGAAVAEGLVQGYDGGLFRPDRLLSRLEAAVILVRVLEAAGRDPLDDPAGGDGDGNGMLNAFTDREAVPSWAAPYVNAAVRTGILNGYQDGTLRPYASITRAELAAMVRRTLEASGMMEGGGDAS